VEERARERERETERQVDTQTGKKTVSQKTDRLTDGKTDRHVDRQTHTQTHKESARACISKRVRDHMDESWHIPIESRNKIFEQCRGGYKVFAKGVDNRGGAHKEN